MIELLFAAFLSVAGGQHAEASEPQFYRRPSIAEKTPPSGEQEAVRVAYEEAISIGAREYCLANADRMNADFQTCYTLLTMQASANARALSQSRTWEF